MNNKSNIDLENCNSQLNQNTVSYAEAVRKNIDLPDAETVNNNIGDLLLQNDVCSENSSPRDTDTTSETLFESACSRLNDDSLEFVDVLAKGESLENTVISNDGSFAASSSSEVTLEHFTSEILKNLNSSENSSNLFSNTTNSTTACDEDNSSDLSYDTSSVDENEQQSNTGTQYPTAVQWQFRVRNPELPETVTVLNAPGGGTIYLVGTAHFSLESQEDVAKTIRATQPDVVLVELCHSRVSILSLDETTLLEETKKINLEKIRTVLRQFGVVQGILHLLLLSMSAHLTEQLGMAPGGEFRKAFNEAKKVPGCVVHLGDRPIQITLRRALATLPWWKKLRIGWYMLTSREPISKQQVERCKQRDLLEETLAEMTGEFPELSRVFVQERDIYLAYSLQMASTLMPSRISPSGVTSTVVVGVVGIGHVPGIVEKWGSVTENDIPPILSVPESSRASKLFLKVIRLSVCGLLLYGTYRCGHVIYKNINISPSWLKW